MRVTVEYIRYVLTQHAPAELIDAYRVAGEHLKAAPECLGYELSHCEEERSSLILRIQWRSTQAHLEGFRRGPHFGPFLKAIQPFIGEIAEMRHYQPSALVWDRLGGGTEIP